jgi:hypothetical protein
MIVFGLAEIVTGFRHVFFGLTTAVSVVSTASGVGLGVLYVASGACALLATRRAFLTASILLALDVIGRIGMVATGLFPLSSSRQVVGIVGGTVIAAGFMAYSVRRWREFTLA